LPQLNLLILQVYKILLILNSLKILFTDFLDQISFVKKNWLAIKLTLKSIEDSNAFPSSDDTIVHKPLTQPNEIVEYY